MVHHSPQNISDVITLAIGDSDDIAVVYDRNDRITYCNDAFANLLDLSTVEVIGRSFASFIRHCHQNSKGMLINTDNIEAWIERANSKRWVKTYRSFEVDIVGGRWIKMTEQLIGDYLFLFGVDITENKCLQFKLETAQKKLIEAASTDFLTGIFNRRQFTKSAEMEIERSVRNQSPLTLLLFDLDFFKRINDRYGHSAGDAVLIEFVERVKKCLRQYDIFARIGGEEFAVLLPNSSPETAEQIATRCLTMINSTHILHGSQQIKLTCSIGLSESLCENGTLDYLLKSADKNMYIAKKLGRNQVVVP